MLFGHFTGKVVRRGFLSGRCGGSYFLKKASDYFMFLLESKSHMAEHTGKERLAKPGGGVLTVRTVCYFSKRPFFSSQSLAI